MPGAQLLSNDSANAGSASVLRPLVALVVVGFAAFELRHFLADGLPIFFDAPSHVSRSWMTARALSAGHYPVWSNDWYAGYRLLEFYSPAYYLVTGALSALTRDVVATTKLVLFVGQIGAVLGFYAYVLRVTGRPLAAGFAAVLLIESVEQQSGGAPESGDRANWRAVLINAPGLRGGSVLTAGTWPSAEAREAVPGQLTIEAANDEVAAEGAG